MVLTDAHRAFVQAMMSRRYLGVAEAEKLKTDACREFQQKGLVCVTLADFIKPLNDELLRLDFALRIAQSHDTDDQILLFVNTSADETAKLATSHNASQISFIKKSIELIVTAEDQSFTSSAINLYNNAIDKKHTGFQKRDAEALVNNLVDDLWLSQCDDGLTLGPRTYVELKFYLQDTFEDALKECVICHDVVGRGEVCSNRECGTKVHKRCATKVARCPKCRSQWQPNTNSTSTTERDPPSTSAGHGASSSSA